MISSRIWLNPLVGGSLVQQPQKIGKKKPTNLVQKREGINNKPTKLKTLQMPLSLALKWKKINLHCHLWVAIIFYYVPHF
jgi:hypothetical protein